jgi:hypothetical protein
VRAHVAPGLLLCAPLLWLHPYGLARVWQPSVEQLRLNASGKHGADELF